MHTYTVVNRVERAPRWALPLALIAFAVGGCGGGDHKAPASRAPSSIRVSSPQFQDGGEIPRANTCDGAGTSPELGFSGLPAKTAEVAVLVDDPDAPSGDFRHWTLWGVKPDARSIRAGAPPAGSKTADNDAGKPGWTGPCPPEGDSQHHYVFSVRALGEPIDAANGADAGTARDEIDKATIAQGEITGTYGR